MRRAVALAALAGACLLFAAPAAADDWLPHPADASWTYEWTDSVYNPTPTKEKVTVKEQKGRSFVLQWSTLGQGNAPEAPISIGTVSFQETTAGLLNTDWSSTPPPPAFPILCSAVTQCNNSLASTYYAIIWGTRGPVLAAPLLDGTSWNSTGGAQGDVTSTSDYVGVERISVPAFPAPVLAAKLRSEVTQAGAIGDPYGSGVRTTWWVYGVGPVKVTIQHAGGDAPLSTYTLVETNQVAKAPPPDERYFPLEKGAKSKYRWTNTKHLKQASIQEVTTDEVLNGSARFSVKHLSGPIRVAGAYGFTMRGDGATNIWAVTKSASLSTLPQLGPRHLRKDRRRHFTTPIDLMIYGFNPVIPAYPFRGTVWKSSTGSRDFSIFGVTGTTRILGTRTLQVAGRTYKRVLVVQSRLVQRGFPFGSGTRTSYFAPGKGLVKLVFRHGDRSVSTVQLVR